MGRRRKWWGEAGENTVSSSLPLLTAAPAVSLDLPPGPHSAFAASPQALCLATLAVRTVALGFAMGLLIQLTVQQSGPDRLLNLRTKSVLFLLEPGKCYQQQLGWYCFKTLTPHVVVAAFDFTTIA